MLRRMRNGLILMLSAVFVLLCGIVDFAYLQVDETKGYLFDPNGGSQQVLVSLLGFRSKDEMLQTWYNYWLEHIEDITYQNHYYSVYEKANEPFDWGFCLGFTGCLLLTVGFVVCMVIVARKISKEDNIFIEKIPMAVRLLSALPRYPGR